MAVAHFAARTSPGVMLPILNARPSLAADLQLRVSVFRAVAGGGPWSVDERNRARANRLTRRARATPSSSERAHDDAEHQL